ncbi:MAG: hypothetical protein WD009_12475 [Phycisphaeraceae bacterium]
MTPNQDQHEMIIHCGSDLLFATRIRHAADAAGLASRSAADADELARVAADLTEAGQGDDVTLVLVDLAGSEAALRTIARARELLPAARVLAFGPHVDKALLDAARQHGAHAVLPRSAFTAKLNDILHGRA